MLSILALDWGGTALAASWLFFYKPKLFLFRQNSWFEWMGVVVPIESSPLQQCDLLDVGPSIDELAILTKQRVSQEEGWNLADSVSRLLDRRIMARAIEDGLRMASAAVLSARCAWIAFCIAVAFAPRLALGQVIVPSIDPAFVIQVKADQVAKERRGQYDLLAFTGHCQLSQGSLTASANEILLWIERSFPNEPNAPGKIICLMNGEVRLDWADKQSLRDQRWMGRFFSLHAVQYEALREVQRFDIPQLDWNLDPDGLSTVQLAQFLQHGTNSTVVTNGATDLLPTPPLLTPSNNQTITQSKAAPSVSSASSIPSTPGATIWNSGGSTSTEGSTGSTLPSVGLVIPPDGSAPFPAVNQIIAEEVPAFPSMQSQTVLQPTMPGPIGVKNVRFFQRNSNSTIAFRPDPTTGENVLEMRGGFRLVVEGIRLQQANGNNIELGTISLEADNAIVWLHGSGGNPFEGLVSSPDKPIELYLDGNIVFNQGNRVIYADRMYYNVSSEYGMVLSAEMLTPVPQYQGLLRLKADVLQQIDQRNFRAFGTALTSSRMGVPKYWLQSNEVTLEDRRTDENLSVLTMSDTSRPTDMYASAKSNFLYVGGMPVLFWPTFNSNLVNANLYLNSAQYKKDRIFGDQLYLDWDLYQLLGIRGLQGTDLQFSTDYLSRRGVALGGRFTYDRPTWLFGAPGVGITDAWFIRDRGQDFLGLDRTSLTPEKRTRGRFFSKNRIFLSPNVELMSESGWVSDRNFLEQYFENDWDQDKDQVTGARLRRYNGNRLFEIFGQAQVNNFFNETESLPRINHYWLGQDLGRLTWNAHTSVGYVHQRIATTPLDPVDNAKFQYLPWEADAEGLRTLTRHELSLPMNLGAVRIVPYVLGEVGFWNQDINRQELTRTAGQVGLRTSLPFWRANNSVGSNLFDINGLAHKVNMYSDVFLADVNQDHRLLPLYDPLDDNSQEHFRRRFIFDTFGGTLPERFDERNYAIRSGMQRWVTAYSGEIFARTQQARVGIDQRWQTKRGLPGQERIVDLASLDVSLVAFPRAGRDNFGEDVGGLNYAYRYHIGDRVTLLSDGYADLFSNGLRTISLGASMSRPGVGDTYVGMTSIEGPISASILSAYTNYRLNEKWIIGGGAAFDFGRTGSIGQTLNITRVGESALIRVGMNVDSGRDNVAFNFGIEPRFAPSKKRGQLGGELIAPAGLFGVE